jgi:hypothetical protein
MNIIKILFWGVIIGLITLVISQNLEFFSSRQSLGINLGFWQYRTPEVLNGIVFMAFFIAGFLSSYLTTVIERFRSKKAIRLLNRTCDAQIEEIGILKGRLNRVQGPSSPPQPESKPESKPESQTS